MVGEVARRGVGQEDSNEEGITELKRELRTCLIGWKFGPMCLHRFSSTDYLCTVVVSALVTDRPSQTLHVRAA